MADIISFSPPDPEDKSRMDCIVDAMFQVLPAISQEDIATRLAKELGRKVKVEEVGYIILYIRRNAETYGWTIPHARRGPATGELRYFHVLIEKGKDPYFDTAHEMALSEGLIGTVTHASSSLAHEHTALLAAAAYHKSHPAAKWIRSLARRIGQIGEDITELVKMLRDEDAA